MTAGLAKLTSLPDLISGKCALLMSQFSALSEYDKSLVKIFLTLYGLKTIYACVTESTIVLVCCM